MPPGNEPAELPVGEYVAQVKGALAQLSPDNRRFFLAEVLPLWVDGLSEGLDPRMTLYASAVKSAAAEAKVPVHQERLAASLDMSTVDGRVPSSRNALSLNEVSGTLLDGASLVRAGSRGHFLQENLAPLLGTLTGGLAGEDLTYAQAVVAAVNHDRIEQRLKGHPVYDPQTPVRAPEMAPRYGGTGMGRVVPASARTADPVAARGVSSAGNTTPRTRARRPGTGGKNTP